MNKYLIKSKETYLCHNNKFFYWSKPEWAKKEILKFNWITIRLQIIIMRILGYKDELRKEKVKT